MAFWSPLLVTRMSSRNSIGALVACTAVVSAGVGAAVTGAVIAHRQRRSARRADAEDIDREPRKQRSENKPDGEKVLDGQSGTNLLEENGHDPPRTTEDFNRRQLPPHENGWEDRESIEVKNMGEVLTYLLNPAV